VVFDDLTKREVYKITLDTRDELLARILDDAAGIKRSEDRLTRTTRDFRTRDAKCFKFDGWIFEHSLWTPTN
jgi:hypothetical protein